ncbi:MAG: GDSL-like lipase/acylhydrolase [Bacillus sp. (in: firmicutes)]|nr:GDSL-like lipase/acylhydrolase [Bacillus sp. (in: firmicutes)]
MRNYTILTYMVMVLMIVVLSGSSVQRNVLAVVALGDSITYGTGDPLNKGYIGRFNEQFERLKGTPVHINNYGIPGYTAENLIEQLKSEKIKKEIQESNYIIVYIGTNDFRRSAKYQFNPINLKKMKDGRSDFSRNLQQILEEIRNENGSAPIIMMGLYNPYTQYKNHKQILAEINKWNKDITKVSSYYEPNMFVPTIDLFEGKPKKRYFSDSLHPNAAGYELISNRLFEKMLILSDSNH